VQVQVPGRFPSFLRRADFYLFWMEIAMDFEIFSTSTALVERAANLFTESALEAVATRGRFAVALSGGGTPRALYARLASSGFSGRIPWLSVHLFWGDERCVPPDQAESNYRTAAEYLLKNISIPAQNVHRIAGELRPVRAAARYENELRAFFGKIPVFDLVLLGMGEDGHTASLFPGSTALNKSKRWVVSVSHKTPPPPLVSRVTLTFRTLNNARRVVFLVSGAGKAPRLAEIRRGAANLPAANIQPVDGELFWLVEQSAISDQ